jgi:hypothetical protein
MDEELDVLTARKIISKLKAGTTPLDYVDYLNVGNEKWYRGAEELFDQIEEDNDSLVRFVKGYYGEGKTHFLGMLRSKAFRRNWAVSYVTAENTPLNKFEQVYSEIVKNIIVPPNVSRLPWLTTAPKGALALLGLYFTKLYVRVNDSFDKSGLSKLNVLHMVRDKVMHFTASSGIDESFGSALRAYIEAAMAGNDQVMNQMSAWIEGTNVKFPQLGIPKPINRVSARDMMRAISILALGAGIKGVLVLLDEAERIMNQSKSIRNKSYGVIRDILDNADDQAGMKSAMVYIASTPDMFESQTGFAEYDALRSRLENVSRFSSAGFVDWRGVIIDLTRTPLPNGMLKLLAQKVIDMHAKARSWNPSSAFSDGQVEHVLDIIRSRTLQVSKPRLLASYMASLLEIVEQNPGIDVKSTIDQTFDSVVNTVSQRNLELWNE